MSYVILVPDNLNKAGLDAQVARGIRCALHGDAGRSGSP